jgi:Zn-dependent peptidase ImmA (M78 family)
VARGTPAIINHRMLKWAREARGFSLDVAAKKLAISQKELESYELGIEGLTFAKLRTVASLYKRPTATFYLDNPPLPIKIPGFRRLPDREEDPLSPELRLEIRKFHQKREAAIELQEYGPLFNWDYVGSTSLNDDPESVGLRIRSMLKIPDDFPKRLDKYGAFNRWREAIEDLGTLVFLIRNVQVDEMRGMSIAERPFPYIAVNRKDAPRPRSFTLLHEFCHILLRDSSVCAIHHEFGEDPGKHEVFCNHVAGAALVPKNLLLDTEIVKSHGSSEIWSDSELRALSARFRVSREVILRRLLILKRTTDGFYRAVKDKLGYLPPRRKGGGGGEKAHVRILKTDGLVFTSLVLEALNRNAITYADASEMLGIKLKHLGQLEALVEEKGR